MYKCVSVLLNKAGKNLITRVNAETQEIPTLMFCLDALSPPRGRTKEQNLEVLNS